MDSQKDSNVSRLFFLSSLALFTAGLSFSLRGAIAGGIGSVNTWTRHRGDGYALKHKRLGNGGGDGLEANGGKQVVH